MIIFIKLILLIIISILWRLGGWDKSKWSGYRDILVPIILGVYIGIEYHWLVGFFTIGAFQIIRLGYGAYDPEHDDKPSLLASITHDREGWINRGLVGLIYSMVGLIPLCIYWYSHDLITSHFIIKLCKYSTINLFIGGVLSKLKTRDVIIEPAIGAGIGLLIFLF